MNFKALYAIALLILVATACARAAAEKGEKGTTTAVNTSTTANGIQKIVKTDDEWKKLLTPDQYKVLRKQGTERAFTGEYWNNHAKGTYVCAACGLPLFSSEAKFESGTGWPSFWTELPGALGKQTDNQLALETRTEYHCAQCLGHQGHVFDDGPKPTGLRYCNNGVALKFIAA